ncbi:MAG: ATP-dependent protease ATPase subunit HslU [Balneolaceae bacterium]
MNPIAEKNLTPGQIVEALDRYIIGQRDAKRSVAISLRNRWRRLHADPEIREEIIPNNILMIGPTGVGKTEIARRLAKLAHAPFIKVEASKFTEVGYVGRDVESMIRDLVDISVNMVKQEMQERVREKAEKRVEERILDILIPPVRSNRNSSAAGSESDFDPQEASDQELKASDQELNERTREKFREKLKRGDLEDRNIEIEVSPRNKPTMQLFGPQGMEEMGLNLQDMLGNLTKANKRVKRSLPIQEAREILLEEEAEKLIDHEAATQEALDRVQNQGIVFIDEIDKVADSGSSQGKGSGDVSRQGVQRDLLPIVEGSNVTTRYGMVRTDHILFIGSGAFHMSKPSDLIPEMQGRFPIRVELDSLTEKDFYDILTKPKNALTRQYQAMLASEGVEIEFEEEAIRAIAGIAAQVNEQVENIGARRLHTILSSLLEELLFAIPDDIKSGKITIDKEYVEKQLNELATDKDLSHYIL